MRTVRLGGAIAASLGFAVLLGWALRLPFLIGFGSIGIPMAPSTALLFVLSGIATILRGRLAFGTGARVFGVAVNAGSALVALSLLTLSSWGIRPSAELLGFAVVGRVGEVPLGHMSPVTAMGFLLASVSFFGSLPSSMRRSWHAEAAWGTAGLLVATSCVLLLAYVLGSPLFYNGSFVPPAATTSVAFGALGTALLALAGSTAGPPGSTVRPSSRVPQSLVLVFVLLASGIVTVGGLWFRWYARSYRAEVERGLSAVAELKTRELTQWRAERLDDGAVFRDNAAFSSLVRRAYDDPREGKARAQLRAWLTSVQAHSPYDRLSLLDAGGVVRLTVPEGLAPLPLVVNESALEISRSARVTLQDFHRDEHDARIYLSVLIPILDERGGTLGVLALRIDPQKHLYPYLAGWPTPAETAETLLVRRDGHEVLFLNEARSGTPTALTARVPLASRDVVAVKAVLGQEGIVEGRDHRGVAVIAALRAVPGSPWFLVARMDTAEVDAPLRERLWRMVFLVAGMLAAAAVGAAVLWRGQRGREIQGWYEAEQERAWLHDVIARSLNEVYIFDAETLRFRFVNRGACRNIGYTHEELAGLTPVDIKPEFTAGTFRSMLEPLRGAERPAQVFETLHRRKNGSEYPVEVHLQLMDSGAGPVFLAFINDITERRKAEARIRHLNRVYAVLSAVNAAIVRVGEPPALYAEACRIAVETGGFRMAWVGLLDAKAQSVRPVAHAGMTDDDLNRLQIGSADGPLGPAAGVLRKGAHYVCNDIEHDPLLAAWRGDAVALGYRASAALPLTVKGESAGLFALYASEPGFFDTEELRLLDEMARNLSFAMEMARLEGQLLQSQRLEAVGQLAGGVAHDFNNILGVITGHGELAQRQLGPEHPVRARVDQMVEAAERAASLTRQLLAFSRKQVMQPKLLDLNVTVADTRKMLDRLISEDITFVVRPAPGLGMVMADPTQIGQIILNLGVNARDAMPMGGSLTLETANVDLDADYAVTHPPTTPGRYVMLAVSDTGIGMGEETQQHIFEPFFTTKPLGQGTGLGLATVYGIVKQSGGYIWVYSEPGRGTTFKVYLPRVDAPGEAARSPSPRTDAPRGHETILLVEDAETLRAVMQETLEERGYTVLHASDGEEALLLCREHQGAIDLLLTDVVMPKVGGGELAKRLSASRPRMHVLYMSGYTDGVVSHHGVLGQGVMLLEKPFTGDRLARAVRAALDRPTSA